MAILTLPDGRALDVRVSGPSDGLPLVYHHGTPGSGVPFGSMARGAHERGLRFVSFSRAGYGASSRQAGRAVVDVAADVAAILDELAAPRCLVAGWSGGGPHALATAARRPDRVAAVLVIAGVAPYGVGGLDFLGGMGEQNVEEFGWALAGEAVLRPHLTDVAAELAGAGAGELISGLASVLPEVDRQVMTAEFGDELAAQLAEGLRAGVDGWVDDDLAFVTPWGFEPAEVSVPTFLWQGSEDLMVPFAHGQWLAAHLPGVVAHLEPGQGHLSIGVGAVDLMLDELVDSQAG